MICCGAWGVAKNIEGAGFSGGGRVCAFADLYDGWALNKALGGCLFSRSCCCVLINKINM